MVGGIAEIRWMVSRGWKRVLEPRPRHMSRIFIRGLPPIPSISTLLAADPCHASRAASPTDVASIVPGQFASRRGIISAHCHRLIESGSEQNRSRQIAPTCPLPSNLPFRPKFRSRDANAVYRITSLQDLPLDFHSKLRIHDSSIFHSVQLFAPFFLFYGHGTRNYEGSDRITRFVSLSRPRDTTARAGNNGRLVKRSQRSACHALPESSIALLGASVGVARGRDGSVYERVCHGNTVVDTTPTLPFAAGQHQTSGCRAVSVAATPAFFDAIGSPRSVVTNLIISRTSLFALAGNGMRSSKKRGSRLL